MNFNEILVKKLTGQVLTSDESAFLIANIAKVQDVANEATKLADETANKAKFDEFFANLKTMSFSGFDEFFAHVNGFKPTKGRKGTGNGTTEVTVYATLQDALNAPTGYPQAIATALSTQSPMTETDLCKAIEDLLPDNNKKYTLSRVRYHAKHQLPFVAKNGDKYSITAPTPTPAPEK